VKKVFANFAVATCLAAVLTTTANAALTTYEWVPGTIGDITADSGTLTFDPTLSGTSSPITYNFSWTDGTGVYSDNGTLAIGYVILPDGDLLLSGTPNSPSGTYWQFGTFETPNEDAFVASPGYGMYGDWVPEATSQGGIPVPEPTTVFAAALLLLPLGASAFRALRKAPTA
jgi:hypothetical protein